MALVLAPPPSAPLEEHQQRQQAEEEQQQQQGPVSMSLATQGEDAHPPAGAAAALRSLSDAVPLAAEVGAAAVKVHVTLSASNQHHPGTKDNPGQAPTDAPPQEEHQQGLARPAAEAAQHHKPAAAAAQGPQGVPATGASAPPPPPPPRPHEPSAAALLALQQQHGEARRQRVQAYVASLQQQQQQQQRRSIAPCQPISEEGSQPPVPGPLDGGAAAQRQQADPRDDVPVREDVPAWAAKLRRDNVGPMAAQGGSSNYVEFCQREFVDAHGDFQQSGGWARACGCMPM